MEVLHIISKYFEIINKVFFSFLNAHLDVLHEISNVHIHYIEKKVVFLQNLFVILKNISR